MAYDYVHVVALGVLKSRQTSQGHGVVTVRLCSASVFRRKLKTHLFRQSYPDIIM